MRLALILLLLLIAPLSAAADWLWGGADEPMPQVQVAEPFVEWRTGPEIGRAHV